MKAQGTPSKSNYETIPEGVYKGRVYYILDLGTQEEEDFKTKAKKFTRKVRIAYEFPTKLMADGRPFATGRDYNLNLGQAPTAGKPAPNFTNPLLDVIRAITGFACPTNLDGYYEYELDQLIGECAMFQIVHTSKGNAKIKGVYPIEEGVQVPPMVNPPVLLSLDPAEFKREVYDGLSDYWKTIVLKSPEGNAVVNGVAAAAQPEAPADDGPSAADDDIPF